MIKVFVALVALLATCLAEPPVGYQSAQPSGQYGPPEFRSPSDSYGPPSNAVDAFKSPSSRYGPPGVHGAPESTDFDSVAIEAAPRFNGGQRFGQSNGKFGARTSGRYTAAIASSYSAPTNGFGRNSNGLSTSYGAPTNGFGGRNGFSNGLSASYGAPTNGFGGHNGFNGHNALSNTYGAPSSGRSFAVPSSTYGVPNNGFARTAPSSTYGVPSNHIDARQPSTEYGAPGYARKATTEDPLAEPANYEYNYEVRDGEQTGSEFGHQESRENEFARGIYHVLLPDGRMQIVEYEADEEGYRPRIRYEETGAYPAARSGHGGY